MSDKWSQYETSPSQLPTGKEDNSSQIGGQVAGAGIATGGTLAAGAAAKWMADPFVQRAILQHTQINPLRQKYNINPNIKSSDISGEIGKQMNDATNSTKMSSMQFKQNIANEDNAVKGGIIKQTALNISKNLPNWQKSGYEAYGNGLKNIEDTLGKANISIEPDKFNQDVLQKTADTMESRGLVNEANNLRQFGNLRSWGVNEEGSPIGKPISFTDAKQAVVNLSKQNPMAERELRSNWGSHIEDATQGTDVGDQMSTINEAYKPFKQADSVAYKFAGPNPNVLDTTKVTNALHNYYLGNSKGNPETTSFLKALGSGTGNTIPIAGLSDQADAIDSAIAKRNTMLSGQKLDESNNISKINELKTDQANAGTLSNIEKGLESQIETRGKVAGTAVKGGIAIAGLAGLGALKGMVAGSPYGIVQNELMKRVIGVDPVTAIGAAIGDKNAQQQMQQAYQNSQQT